MLDALAEYPAIRLSMHWSGALLEWMELHAPEALDRLLALVAGGRLEILGGLHGGSVLPALPERDVVGQVQAMTRWWRAHADQKLRGAWLPWCAWDPSAARILGRLGLQFTVLEEGQLYPPASSDGYYLTEREGTGLALFVSDTRLSRMIPDVAPSRILKAIALRAREGARLLVLAAPGEAFGAGLDTSATHCFGGDAGGGWVHRFFAALTDNAHWLKLVSFGTVLDKMRPTDRAYPPASVSLPVSLAALGGARGAAYAELLRDLRRGEPGLSRVAPFVRSAQWDHLLARYPEINRLHKRMLMVSAEVMRLRNAIREERAPEGDPRHDALEDATRALYRGQNGAAYVLGVDVGAQDAGVRCQAWADLLRAEYSVAAALGEAEAVRCEQVDYDCDGRAEVVVRTPHLCAILAPSSGGSLVELDAWSLPGNLLNVRTRREEPEHELVKRAENLPAILDPDIDVEIHEDEPTGEPDEPPENHALVAEPDLGGHLHYDRYVRSSFIDRFLGTEATLHNVRLGRFPEAGDFVGADYQLLHLEENEAGNVVVGLARDGNVNEGAALRLVRVLKRFAFARDSSSLDVRYELANRYHEPVRTRFAVEVNLNLDGLEGGDLSLEIDGVRHNVARPGEHGEIGEVALVDGTRGYRLTWRFHQPARLWHYPIETVSRTPAGLARCFQGVCVLAWWPVELWGLERRRFDTTLALDG
jgi:alpha-amylase